MQWMTVAQLIRFVAAHYPTWNSELERRYLAEFELSPGVKASTLAPGERQTLAFLLAIGFEPELLILDEPAAAMDPLARRSFLDLLLDMIQSPNRTIVISSHILSGLEKVIDHALIPDKGGVLRDCLLDDLREEYCKIRLTSLGGVLPDRLPFENVIEEKRNGVQAVMVLGRQAEAVEELGAIAGSSGCRLERLPLPIDDIYRLVVRGGGALR